MSLESFIEEIPEAYYRKAIDLNRYSNSVARELMQSYERVVRRSIAELERIEKMPSAKRPQVRAQRLKALIKQNTEALANWSDKAGQKLASELSDLAKIEVDFTAGQLRRALPDVAQGAVRTVEVTPAFAEAVITADPTNVGTAVLSDNLEEIVSGPAKAMKLTARQGAAIRMPDGRSIGKAFRGLAEQQAQIFATTVQDGLLSGESTQSIARTLIGEGLEFSTKAKSIRQLAQAGGQMTKMATHQVRTLVRTSVNATSNVASQRVYKANPTVTKKYRWLATLDEKTSPICRSLDQQVFEYGKGPTPANPPHFNCRSSTVPVVDWDGLSNKYGIDLTPPRSRAKRPSASGGVPLGTSYGKWLHDQRPKGKKFEASAAQAKALNGGRDTPGARQKARYFNRLADKYGPDKAMKKFLRDDGTEVSLADLKKRYGEPERITATKPKPKPVAKPKPKAAAKPKAPPLPTVRELSIDSPAVSEWMKDYGGSGRLVDDALARVEKEGGLIGEHAKQLRQFTERNRVMSNYSLREQIGDYSATYGGQIDSIIASQKRTVEAMAKDSVMPAPLKRQAQLLLDDLQTPGERREGALKTLFGRREGCGGYTRQSTGAVNVYLRSESKPLGQLGMAEFKRRHEDNLLDAVAVATGQQVPLPFLTSSGVNKKVEWLAIHVHEMGHQIHFKGLGGAAYEGKHKAKGGIAAVSQYGLTNEYERFAEAYSQYVFNPEGLKTHAPGLYSWVEEAITNALKP